MLRPAGALPQESHNLFLVVGPGVVLVTGVGLSLGAVFEVGLGGVGGACLRSLTYLELYLG